MHKNYDHTLESKLYENWESAQIFQPLQNGDPKQKSFSIIMPPPNANGDLHIGHALFVTLQDILTRYHRMQGDATLWLPGADHAGILTQVVYERELEKQNKTRFDLGREHFTANLYEFTLKHRSQMESQLRRLGASCDWSRKAFTLEPRFEAPIATTFKKLYDDGLLYRGERLVNWCSRCQTALSDLETKHEVKETSLWHIRYPTIDGQDEIVVATTRPETLLGDTAVAVHPQDPRWQKLIGRKVRVPLVNRDVPVVADPEVEQDFGTGAVKVTPAHDFFDFALAARHKLPALQVIGFDARLTKLAGVYQGQLVAEARRVIVADLQRQKLLLKTERLTNNVSVCERCGTAIEPQISLQWFVKATPLAQRALKAIEAKQILFKPARFEKQLMRWLKNIQDWCVSRQLWWGHQLPVWYCGTQSLSPLQLALNPIPKTQGCGQIVVSVAPPAKCLNCGLSNLIRDPDTLDTWFSSGQWPFNALGWDFHGDGPHHSPDFDNYYPTSVMETGYDILFMWVARMIMLGLYVTDQVPFKTVYLNGLVKDAQGQKMSKSKGNVINPLQVTQDLGADSLRFALINGAGPGVDLKFNIANAQAGRNFANKIWNLARYLKEKPAAALPEMPKSLVDAWLLTRIRKVLNSVTKDLESLRPNRALETLYAFVWNDFADWYIEVAKIRNHDRAFAYAHAAFKTILAMLHPFMPFVTEAVYQELYTNKTAPLLAIARWPEFMLPSGLAPLAKQFDQFRVLVTAARNIKQLAGIPKTSKPAFTLQAGGLQALFKREQKLFLGLVPASTLTLADLVSTKLSGPRVAGEYGILLLETANSAATEIKQRLNSRVVNLRSRREAKIKLLDSSSFTKKAPTAVVENIRMQVQDINSEIDKIEAALGGF